MQKTIDRTLFDWQRGRNVGIQSRGIASLVVASVKNNEVSLCGNNGTTRCVWPSQTKTTDMNNMSRRIWAR